MADPTLDDPISAANPGSEAAPCTECQECVGSGGWFRYEPALAPAPGLLYLACMQCRGTGKTAAARG